MSVVTFIVAGGILGIAVGVGVGGAAGYALGTWAVWKLLSKAHQRSLAADPT